MKLKIWIPILFVVLIWIINSYQFLFQHDFGKLGIHPRDISTLNGMLFAPFIHGNWNHLFSNTLPLLILGMTLFVSYDKIALKVWLFNYVLTGILVWIFGRGNSYHIGASGIVYGLASFLFFSGFFRMDIKSIAIASGVALFYGGMVWRIMPLESGVSWESHLMGGIVGFILAYFYRNQYKATVIIEHENEQERDRSFEQFLKQQK